MACSLPLAQCAGHPLSQPAFPEERWPAWIPDVTSSASIRLLRSNRADSASARMLAQSGQSLVEVALLVSIFTLMLCYAVDIGYFYMVAASLATSARNAGIYSIQGYSGVAQSTLPPAGPITTTGTVASLAVADLASFVNSSVTAAVYVCSDSLVTPSHPSRCQSYNSAPTPSAIDSDPESAIFTINRVDVYYTIAPPIPLGRLLPQNFVPTQFHRFIELRSLN